MVPCAAFEALFASHREDINAIVNDIDFEDPNEIEAAAGCVRDLLLERNALERIDEAMRDLRQQEDGEALFAVRSSVLDEDSTQHSFAGLMDTCLNVRLEDLARSILSVWASAWNARALAYRHTMGIATTDISAAVIVQRMVVSHAGGVMFTHEPETGAEISVINAAFGLADSVTAGAVCADTYRIAHGSRDVQVQVTDKAGSDAVSAFPARDLRNGYDLKHERRARVLSDENVLQLRDLGLSVYAEFGAPEDIEWALDADHKFWLFQTRPITPAKRAAAVRIWDNSNIVESYEGLTLPLTFSFVRKAYRATFCGAARRFLPLRWRHLERLQVFDQLLGLVDGRVYYNLSSWYVMMAHIPGFPKNKASWEHMVGVREAGQVPEVGLGLLDAIYGASYLAWRLTTARRSAARFFAAFDAYYRRYGGLDLADADAERLAVIYRDAFRRISETWHVTVENDLITMIYVELSHRLLSRWAPGADEATRQRLLCSNGGIESLAPIKSLHLLIEEFAAETRLTGPLAACSSREVLEQIRTDPDLSRLATLFDHHITKYGDRGPAELKLETPTFREQPERLIALIRMGLKTDRTRRQESHETIEHGGKSRTRPSTSIALHHFAPMFRTQSSERFCISC
jgi:pyruvate,water dikinase